MMGGVKGELEIEKTQIFVWTEVRIMIYAKFYIFMFFLFMQCNAMDLLWKKYLIYVYAILPLLYLVHANISVYAKSILFK